ncbi:hypothetical protein B0O80DRAFT_469011 [Mortierella sp. GBAus27b]|nr:hypothetical protein B0O80DRAFT_469011 [Mortierella sp. GBAus27b]
MISSSGATSTAPSSPRMFYKVLEDSSPSKRAESIASSTSISTIASSGDISTTNDGTSDGLSTTATEVSQSKSSGSGSLFLELVTGGKYKKDKRVRSASSSYNSNGGGVSPALKLFSSGVCSYSGCTQPAKSCVYHKKKSRPHSPKGNDKLKKPLSNSSDRSVTQGSNISDVTSPRFSDGSPSSSYSGSKPVCNGGLSKSMVSLPRDSDLGIDIPPPPQSHIYAASPTRTRSPSASIIDDALAATRTNFDTILPSDIHPVRSRTPPSHVPSLGLLPPPPRASSSTSNYHIHNGKESLSLSRKMGLQIGGDFGALDQTALDTNYFAAKHHRTIQRLQVSQSSKYASSSQSQALQQQQEHDFHQQQLQQQTHLHQSGVSRHIIAPDVLAQAIEREAEKLRQQQAQENEAQRNRPTSMIKGLHQPVSLQHTLTTVSETSSSATTDGNESTAASQISSPKDYQEGERIISSQEQLAYANPGLTVAKMEVQTSPISSITTAPHPLSPASVAPLPPSMLQSSGLGVTANGNDKMDTFDGPYSFSAAGSDISSTGSSKHLQHHGQKPSFYSPSLFASSSDAEEREFPMHSLPPPKRHWNEPIHGTGLGGAPSRGGLSRRSSATAGVVLSTDTNSSLSNGQDTPPSSASSLRPNYWTRRQSSSPVMIRLSEQGAQNNISPLLNSGATRTFSGDAPLSDVRRPGLTPTSSPSGSSFSTSTVSSSQCSIVTSRHTGHEHHITGAEESLTMTSLESDHPSPAAPGLSPSPEISSPMMHRNRKLRSVSSPLASATPAENSPEGSPSTAHAPHIGGSSLSRTIEAAEMSEEISSSDKVSVTVVDMDDKGLKVATSPRNALHGKESVSPPRRMLQTAGSFVFPAPSAIRRTRYDPSGRPLSTCSTSSFLSDDGGRGEDEEDESARTSDRSGPSSRAESPVLSSSLHAAALELYPSLRKFSLFTAATGGHPPPALLTRRKGSSASVASSTRDHHSVAPSGLSHMDNATDDDQYDDDDGADSYEEDWAGNLKSTRLMREPLTRRASLPISPQMQSQLQSRLSTPPPSHGASLSSSYSRGSPPSPTTPPPTPLLPNSSVSSSLSGLFASHPRTSRSHTLPTFESSSVPSSQYSGSLVEAPPSIPVRSPHRSMPAAPTPLRIPQPNQRLPGVLDIA